MTCASESQHHRLPRCTAAPYTVAWSGNMSTQFVLRTLDPRFLFPNYIVSSARLVISRSRVAPCARSNQ